MEKRFILPTIVSLILVVIAIGLSLLPIIGGDPVPDLIPILPGNTYIDIISTMVIPYLALFIVLILGPLIAISLSKLHKLMKLKKYDYFIFISEKKLSGLRILLRTVFGGLLAVNIAIYISLSEFASQVYHLGSDSAYLYATIEYAAVFIGLPIACFIVLPIWMIESSGLMCSRKVELYNRPVSPDIESVGEFFLKLLKGYVGISTILSYAMILIDVLNNPTGSNTWMFVFVDPIIIIMLFLPMSLLIEIMATKTNTRLHALYEKSGIESKPKIIKIE